MTDPMTDHLPTLRALNKRFIHNFVTSDVPSHDAILHPGFRCIQPNGSLVARDAYLRYWASGFDPKVVPSFDMRGETIEVVGPTALVGAVTRSVRVKDGVETASMTRYTDTYVLERGNWLCVLAQLTAVAPEHYPPDSTIVVKYLEGKLQ
jgi:hypothetical protein